MKKLIFFLLLCLQFVYAQIEFPKLTGRVVDNANILTQEERVSLSELLKQHEKLTTNQIVVVTLPTLNGYEIADYGYQLGRHWGIGTKEKNNGALLIVALSERKIRIEVGYGLEGQLTDKLSSDIIEYIIKPSFKQKKFFEGIYNATHEMIKILNNESTFNPVKKTNASNKLNPVFFIILIVIFSTLASIARKAKHLSVYKISNSIRISSIAGFISSALGLGLLITVGAFVIVFFIMFFIFLHNLKYEDLPPQEYLASGYKDSSSGSFGGFGGFSGGGGSFGGGGASGGW